MIHFSLATVLLTICPRGDAGRALRTWISKIERTKRWNAERATIKAEVTRAKQTFDLLRMARAVARLDALDAEIEAAQQAETGCHSKPQSVFENDAAGIAR